MVSETGRQLGILFGFIGLLLVSTATYAIVWRRKNKQGLRKDAERKAALIEAGFGPRNEDDTENGGERAKRTIPEGEDIV